MFFFFSTTLFSIKKNISAIPYYIVFAKIGEKNSLIISSFIIKIGITQNYSLRRIPFKNPLVAFENETRSPHLREFGVVEQIGTMSMNESTEGETVPPGQVEVVHAHVLVGSSLTLAPEQQSFLGGHLLYRDILDCKPANRNSQNSQALDFFSLLTRLIFELRSRGEALVYLLTTTQRF